MLRNIVVSLLCLLALPASAQYNIKKMMEEGRRTLDQGYYVVSMQIFNRITALKPNLYEAWYLMALSKYHLEDYKGTVNDCQSALTLQPYIADIYELYGMANIRLERYDSAIVAYTHALDINPDNRDYWFNRAYCLYQIADKQQATQQLAYILKRWPTFAAAKQLNDEIKAGRKPQQQPSRPSKTLFPLKGLNNSISTK